MMSKETLSSSFGSGTYVGIGVFGEKTPDSGAWPGGKPHRSPTPVPGPYDPGLIISSGF